MTEQTFTESDIREAMAEWLEHETIDQGQAAADSFMKHLTRPKIEFAEGEWIMDMCIVRFDNRDGFIDPIAQPLENMSQQMRDLYNWCKNADSKFIHLWSLVKAFEQHHGIGGE